MTRITDPHENELGSTQQPANGKVILLAEDDPFIARMYQTKLSAAGFQVVRADNGRDAYERAKDSSPDLIMMDLNMPEMSGFEVIKALAAEDAAFSADKVLVLTNSAGTADRQLASSLGVDYMVKAEMTPREVLNRINQKLGLPVQQ